MSLRDQKVDVVFRGGLDLKTDGKLVLPSKLLVATDVEFDGADTIVTRAGTETRAMAGGFTNPIRIFEHGGVPVVEFEDGSTLRAPDGGTGFGAFGAAAQSYEPNVFPRTDVKTRRAQALVAKPTAPGAGVPLYDRNFDVAEGTSHYCIAWEEPGYTGRMAVKYSVRRLDNDAEVQFGIFSGSGGSSDVYVKPRVTFDSVNSRFAIFTAHFLSGGTSYDVEGTYLPQAGGALVGPAVMIAVPAGGTVEGAIGLEALFDVAVTPTPATFGGAAYSVCARQTNGAGNIFMRQMTSTLTAIVATTNAAPATKPVSLTAHGTFSAGVLLSHAFFGAGANLRGYRLPSNTGVQSAEVTLITVGVSPVGRVAVTDNVAGTSLYLVFDSFSATSATFATTYVASCTTAHAGVTWTAVGTNCFISGRVFTLRNRRSIPMTFTSAQYQSVTLVLDVDCAIRNLGVATQAQPLFTARLDWGETANPSPLALDSAHRVPGCSETLMPYLKYEVNTRLAGTTDTTPVAVALASFNPYSQLGDMKWNGDTYLAGAMPMVTDGQRLVEEGFHWNPEVVGTVTNGLVVVPPVATTTGIYDFPAVGSYICAFTESWQDSQGNWHESGVSFLCSVTTTAGNLGINPTIIRPPSLKRDQSQLVAGYKTGLTMYRTKLLGTDTTMYLAHSGELGAGAGYINDTLLGQGEVLYTEGGTLGNTPAPACRHMALFDDRMVLSGCGDGKRLYWTKQVSAGFAAEFVSDEPSFQQVTPADAVATVEMNGKLVVLLEDRIGIIYGTGPSNSGEGQYASMDTVAENIGAYWPAPKSVKLSADGVWFQSRYGLRLFNGAGIARDNSGKFVGSEVDSLITAEYVVTLAGGSEQQTRFFLAGGDSALIWDQTWGQFTQFNNHTSTDACMVGGEYFFLSGDTLRYRNGITSQDSGAPLSCAIRTAFLKLDGIQGFQRARKMLLLGNAQPNSVNAVQLDVSYDELANDVTEFSGNVVANAQGTLQFEHQFWKQKCQGITLAITFPVVTSRVRLTGLSLGVAIKGGLWKSAEVK